VVCKAVDGVQNAPRYFKRILELHTTCCSSLPPTAAFGAENHASVNTKSTS